MAWRKVLIWGAVASAASASAVGCKVTVCSGDDCHFDGGFFEDAGTGGSSAGGAATGGSSGSGGASGAGGSSGSGGASGAGGSSGAGGTAVDAGPDAPIQTECHPEQDTGDCAKCIETKCCQEWLDCVNDTDCLKPVSGKEEEFNCIQDCLVHDDAGIKDLDTCAGDCAHDSVGVSSATSALIGCMRDMGDSGTEQKCTNQCFLRDLP
jgi:hypothetical protein